jgi:peroxiredoxin
MILSSKSARYLYKIGMLQLSGLLTIKFGIDLPAHNSDDTWTLPMPARLIIDPERVIRCAEINADYTIRPEPEDTLAFLKTQSWK